MKLLTCFALLALILSAQPQQQQSTAPQESKPEDLGAVEGLVLSNATGEPVRKAELRMMGTERTAGGVPLSYSAVTDAGGKFTIKDLEPGKYRLSIHRTGFVDMQYGARGPGRGGTVITLRKAERLKDISIKLIPQAVISGRVADEKNEPLASVQVNAKRYSYFQGKRQLIDAGTANTNDLGEYRIYGLAPGRYYLVAAYNQWDYEALQDRSANPTAENYVATYYPGTAEATAAAPVEVGPGVQLRGANLTMAKARTYRVRGHVGGRPNVNISFFKRGELRWMSTNVERMTDGRGDFEISDVQPGSYTLLATAWADRKMLSARQQIDVSDQNVENVSLTVEPGIEIQGSVTVEGQGTPDFNNTVVALRNDDGEFSAGDRVHDGTFALDNVSLGSFRVHVSGLPDGYWVRSVKMGEQEVKESGIDLSHGPAGPIALTIAPNAGQINGTVLNEKQQPAAGSTVVLVPEPKLRDRDDAYKVSTADQYGSFSLKNIEPGEYKLFAWEEVDYGAYMDPEFLKPLEDRSQSVTIQEGSRETVQLSTIPADSAAKTRGQ